MIEEHINEVVANYGRDEKLLPQERKHNSIEEEQFEDALFEEPQKCVSDEVDAKNIEEILTDRSQNQTRMDLLKLLIQEHLPKTSPMSIHR